MRPCSDWRILRDSRSNQIQLNYLITMSTYFSFKAFYVLIYGIQRRLFIYRIIRENNIGFHVYMLHMHLPGFNMEDLVHIYMEPRSNTHSYILTHNATEYTYSSKYPCVGVMRSCFIYSYMIKSTYVSDVH